MKASAQRTGGAISVSGSPVALRFARYATMAMPIVSLAIINACRPGTKFCGATKSTNVKSMSPPKATERLAGRVLAR